MFYALFMIKTWKSVISIQMFLTKNAVKIQKLSIWMWSGTDNQPEYAWI